MSMRLVLIVGLCGGLAACGQGQGSKEFGGTALGAVGGGLIGNQFGKGNGKLAATAVGAVAGGLIGNDIGRKLDQRDRLLAQRAETNALERGVSGQPTAWRNPDNGRHGSITPGPGYNRGGGQCRDYTHTVYIDGRPEAIRGSACRNPDGTWRQIT
jgi:surface antigen